MGWRVSVSSSGLESLTHPVPPCSSSPQVRGGITKTFVETPMGPSSVTRLLRAEDPETPKGRSSRPSPGGEQVSEVVDEPLHALALISRLQDGPRKLKLFHVARNDINQGGSRLGPRTSPSAADGRVPLVNGKTKACAFHHAATYSI